MFLALVLVAGIVVFAVRGAQADSGDSRAQALSRQYDEVTKAATEETEAFLNVDYRNMDPLIEKVLAGAAGSFKTQYSGARANLKASAAAAQAVSTGKVLHAGVGDIDGTNAVVFVAADSQVKNKSTKGKAQPRYYRLKLDLVRQGGKWLTSDLQFVG